MPGAMLGDDARRRCAPPPRRKLSSVSVTIAVEVERLAVDLDAARFEPRHVEDVGDHAKQERAGSR